MFPFPGPKDWCCRAALCCLEAGLLHLEESCHKDNAKRATGHKQQWLTTSAGFPEPQGRKHPRLARNPCNILFSGACRSHTALSERAASQLGGRSCTPLCQHAWLCDAKAGGGTWETKSFTLSSHCKRQNNPGKTVHLMKARNSEIATVRRCSVLFLHRARRSSLSARLCSKMGSTAFTAPPASPHQDCALCPPPLSSPSYLQQ